MMRKRTSQIHTVFNWDWFETAEVAMIELLADVASWLLRPANGCTLRQPCMYWDIRTDARFVVSPEVRTFA